MSSEQSDTLKYIENRPFDDLQLGDFAELERVLTTQDIEAFAAVSGDVNPAHVDPDFARDDVFHKVIAHGMWGGALISNVLGTELPGPGTIYLTQTLKFLRPVGVGDKVNVRVTVTHMDALKRRVTLDCACTNGNGTVVITGEAVVLAPDKKIRRPRVAVPDLILHHRTAVLEQLLERAKPLPPQRTAIIHPCEPNALEGAIRSAELNLITPILVGPFARIDAAAEEAGLDISQFERVASPHSHASAELGVALVRNGRAQMIMKGALHTDEIMSAVISKTDGLQTERRMSHVYVMDVPTYPKPILITDAAINIAPDLQAKADIVQNAIDLARTIGLEVPKVAILSAVETITPRLGSTVDAAALCKMADRGQITGGILDGPLAFDNAISPQAVAAKGIKSDVAGQADILVAPDLEAGNMMAKQLMYLAGAKAAGVVLGAQVPIVLTSRADDVHSRIASSAVAVLFCAARHS